MLNPRNRFESFVIGRHNEAAVAAARAWVARPLHDKHLLVITAGGPLGKTYLTHAVGNALRDQHPRHRVEFAPALYLENTFAQSVAENSVGAFRRRFGEVDALLVDDVHDFKSGGLAAAEFVCLCSRLLRFGKRVLVTSNISDPPMLQVLRSLPSVGVVDGYITTPDLACCMAILKAKAQSLAISLPLPTARVLAGRASGSIRRLECLLIRVANFAETTGLRVCDLDNATLETAMAEAGVRG